MGHANIKSDFVSGNLIFANKGAGTNAAIEFGVDGGLCCCRRHAGRDTSIDFVLVGIGRIRMRCGGQLQHSVFVARPEIVRSSHRHYFTGLYQFFVRRRLSRRRGNC